MSMCKRIPPLLTLLSLLATASAGWAGDVKIWPFFYRMNDPVTETRRMELLWPLYVRERTPAYSAHQVLSIQQRYPDGYDRQYYLFWPLSGLRKGQDRHDAWLFPFLWSREDSFKLFPFVWVGKNHHAFFPVYYYSHYQHGNRKTLSLLLLQHNHWSEHTRSHRLWPLCWYIRHARAGSESQSVGVLPLFWYSSSSSDRQRSISASRSGGTLLLHQWSRRTSESTGDGSATTKRSADRLFPLYYKSHYENDYRHSGTRQGSRRENAFRLAFYYHGNSSHALNNADGISGIIRSESLRTVFPFWWDWHDQKHAIEKRGRLLFPFWWSSRRLVHGDTEQSARFLVPVGAHFYKKDDYETRNLLGPIFNRTESHRQNFVRYDALFPLLSMTRGETRSGGHIFPIYGSQREDGRYQNAWALFPLLWSCEEQGRAGAYRPPAQFWALHEMESNPFVAPGTMACDPNPARRLQAFYPFAWSLRTADRQSSALLPLWRRRTLRDLDIVQQTTILPLLLGGHTRRERNGETVRTHASAMFSALARGDGQDYRLRRIFPLYSSYQWGSRRRLDMLFPPFAASSHGNPDTPGERFSSSLDIPFGFLPIFSSGLERYPDGSESRVSRLFPFYRYERDGSESDAQTRLSVLWPLWNGEWTQGETRIRSLVNHYERDVNEFVEQRVLRRLYIRRTRSWLSEREIMPFYASQSRGDGQSYWNILGGLLGRERRMGQTFLRLAYFRIPLRTTAADEAPAGTGAKALQRKHGHAELALNYLRHGRYDRAAIEFSLAEGVRDDDLDFQLAAANAYLDADPDAVGRELRSTIPSSLAALAGKDGGRHLHIVRSNLRAAALERFEAALRLGADRTATLAAMADAHRDIGRHEAALDKLDEADRISPSFAFAMMRLNLLYEMGWHQVMARGRQDQKLASAQALPYRQRFLALLEALCRRYPDSPALHFIEAQSPASAGDDGHAWSHYSGYPGPKDAFSHQAMRQLDLYERGAAMQPGAEERIWLGEEAVSRAIMANAGKGGSIRRSWSLPHSLYPARDCAEGALRILNRQATQHLSKKHYDQLDAITDRIFTLLPAACKQCLDENSAKGNAAGMFWHTCSAQNIMRTLYRYYLHERKDPLAYIAMAEARAGALCPHQREAIARTLEPLRFEQQYLKAWKITSPAGTVVHNGGFFDRYIDLDAILQRPVQRIATAECVLISPDARPAVLRLGYDLLLNAELNGKLIFEGRKRKVAVRDEFTVPVGLVAGENRLRFTVSDDKLSYGFFARLSAPDGSRLLDVRVQPAP